MLHIANLLCVIRGVFFLSQECGSVVTWFINKNEEKNLVWETLLPVILPNSVVVTNIYKELSNENNKLSYDFVVCLLSELDRHLEQVIKSTIYNNIPLLCIIDNINQQEYDFLMNLNTKGIISVNASLDAFQTAVSVVKNGGSYIEPIFFK